MGESWFLMAKFLTPGIYTSVVDYSYYRPELKRTFECYEVTNSRVYAEKDCGICSKRIIFPQKAFYMVDYCTHLCSEICREMFIFQNL